MQSLIDSNVLVHQQKSPTNESLSLTELSNFCVCGRVKWRRWEPKYRRKEKWWESQTETHDKDRTLLSTHNITTRSSSTDGWSGGRKKCGAPQGGGAPYYKNQDVRGYAIIELLLVVIHYQSKQCKKKRLASSRRQIGSSEHTLWHCSNYKKPCWQCSIHWCTNEFCSVT